MLDHIGLRVRDVGASVRFYAAALAALGCELASQDESSAGFGPPGAPGLRPDYGASYFAAFLLDPEGNNVEAVCLREA